MDWIIEAVNIFFVMLFGLCFGSFLNVLIYRLPLNMNISKPSSHCPNCGYKLKWYDNIPVLSYIILGGKCRNCKCKISPRYMIVEILTSVLFLLSYLKFHFTGYFFITCVALMCFVTIAFIDFEHYIIPDSLNIVLLIVSLVSLFFKLPGEEHITVNIYDRFIGLGVGLLILLIIFIVEKIVKKEIMGGGDIKLILSVSLMLGYQLLLLGIFISALLACLIEIPLSFNKKYRENHVLPFGPYLVMGFTISLFFGLKIINLYLSLFI